MMKSLKLLASLLLLVSLSGCAIFGGHYQSSDWQASITLPASQDCYSFNVISGKEERLPAESEACQTKKVKSIWIDYESYKLLRRDIEVNCQFAKCKQITGALDSLFLTIDHALQKIPK